MRQWRRQSRTQMRPRPSRVLWMAALAVLAASSILSACGTDPHQHAADANKAKLDAELQHARVELGIPSAMLQPILTQEQKVASGSGGWNYNYQDAATNYTLLYTQLVGIEQTSADTLRKQTDADIRAFTEALNARRNDGFIEATTYQSRLDQALQDYQKAKLPGDFAKIDATVTAQTSALNTMWPAYQQLLVFQSVVQALSKNGINTSLAETEYQQDLQAFRDASPGDRYIRLGNVISGQTTQLLADQTEALPYIGATLLAAYQARIDLLAQYGEDGSAFQQQHDADAKQLASAKQLSDYLTVGQAINDQINAMSLPLLRGKAHADFAVLKQLVTYAHTQTILDHADGNNYPAAYEYEDGGVGIGDARDRLNAASTADDYQNADNEITMMTTNLRALLDNMNDTTSHSQPHQTDLELMQHYGMMQGKVIMVSLTEQTARFYDNGALVYWSYVTTGDPVTPSPPGIHYIESKETNTVFKSPDPPGSPLWYAPTPINYAMYYADYGYYLHDAWWRNEFGPETNLPHWDPAAFNGGSHGCVNFPENHMAYVYDWAPVGTPVVLY